MTRRELRSALRLVHLLAAFRREMGRVMPDCLADQHAVNARALCRELRDEVDDAEDVLSDEDAVQFWAEAQDAVRRAQREHAWLSDEALEVAA
jgi:hypothetical protein